MKPFCNAVDLRIRELGQRVAVAINEHKVRFTPCLVCVHFDVWCKLVSDGAITSLVFDAVVVGVAWCCTRFVMWCTVVYK